MSYLREESLPKVIPSFQADRFTKISNYLNIPDTIPEQYSGELSANSFKMEVPEKKNIKDEISNYSDNHSINSDDNSSNDSTITPVSNSFLKDFEKQLYEFNSSEDNSFFSANSKIEVRDFKKLSKELGFLNDTLSTPPNELRQQIKILRDDMEKTHEFHDLEIQCLKNEKITENESESYLQLYTKYSELLELYTSLKKDYEELKNKHEKVTDELHYTTTSCFEKLCVQIEASDNSLNLSNNSFASFNTEIKSSTMLGFNEIETSLVNEHTILGQDPLALSTDTPIRSSKKLFLFPNNCSGMKEKKIEDITERKENIFDFSSDYTSKVLNLETLLTDKVKEMDDLESRLLKVEDVSKILQEECDRVASIFQKENKMLKEKLSEKSEELDKLSEKLLTETLALNPTLNNSFTELSTFKLLTVFIETIMEICNNVQNQLIKKFDAEKLMWEEQKKADFIHIEELQDQVKTLTNEINSFKCKIKNFDDLSSQKDELQEKLTETNKIILTLNEEMNILQTREELQQTTIHLENNQRENETIHQMKEITYNLENDLFNVKKEINTIEELKETKIRDLKEDILSVTYQNTKLERLFDLLLENKKIYCDALAEVYSNFNENDETVVQLLNEKFQSFLNNSLDDLKDRKWLSVLSEGIITSCNYIKKELNEEISIKADKWKIKINDQAKMIEDLKNQIKDFQKGAEENLNIVSKLKFERENLEKLCDSLKEQLLEAEKNILIRNNENFILKSCEEDLKKAKQDYSSSLESLMKLKSELLSVEKEKLELENKYEKLKETNENLQILISTKDLILQDLDNLKANNAQNNFDDYESIKQQVQESQLIISSLKEQLIIAKSECDRKDDELQKLLIDIQNKENDILLIESLKNQISDLNNKIKDCSSKAENLNVIKNQQNLVEINLEEDKSNTSELIEDNNFLRTQSSEFEKLNENSTLAKDTIEKLQSELLEANTEKKNFEIINNKQETLILNLQSEIRAKITLVEKLQNQIKFFFSDSTENVTKINKMSQEKHSLKNFCDILKELVYEFESHTYLMKKEHKTTLRKMVQDKENIKKQCDCLKEQLFKAEKDILVLKKENEVQLNERLLECNYLKEQLSEMEKEISIMKKDNETKLNETLLEKENLEKQYQHLKDQLSEADNKILILKAENEEQCNQILLEKEDLEKQCGHLKEQLSEADNKILILKAENEEQCNQILLEKDLEKQCGHLKEQLSEAEKIILILKEENGIKLNEKLLEKENLEKQNDNIKEQLTVAEKNISVMKEENEAKLNEILHEKENLEKQCDHVKEQLCEAEKVISALKEENETKLKEISHEKENLEKLYNDLKEQLSETEKNILRTNVIHESNIGKLTFEKEKFEKMSENYKEQLSEALKNISARDNEITVLKIYEEDLKIAKKDLSTADEAIQKLKIEISALETNKLNVENKCFELEAANAKLENSSTAKDKILKDLENYKANSEKIQNDYKTKIEKLEHLREQYDELKEDLAKAENTISLHKQEIGILQSNNKKTEENLSSATEAIEKLQAEITDVKNEKINLEDEYKKLEEKTSSLRFEINTKNIRIKEIEKEVTFYESSKIENKNLKVRISEMEELTKVLKNELDIAKEETINIEKLKDMKLKELKEKILSLGNINNQLEKLFDSLMNNKDLFANVFSSIYSTSNVMDDTLVKLLHDKLKSTLNYSFNGAEDEKWLTVISETIIACCNFVREELNKESMSKEDEWKIKFEDKVTLTENLEIQIDHLRKDTEKKDLKILEMKFEKDKFEKLCENMKIQLNEGEKVIGTLENEMLNFKVCKEDLKKTKLDLVETNKKVLDLQTKLMSTENEKLEIENRCIQLEEEANIKESTKDRTLRNGRTIDLRSRRLDKLEQLNHNLMELVNFILNAINFPNIDKLKLISVRDYPSILKKIKVHLQEMEEKTKNLEATNSELDEECDSYAKTIKDLEKEAAIVWKANKEKTEVLESEIKKLKEEQVAWDRDKENLLEKISKLDNECQKLKAASLPKETSNSCNCGSDLKKIHELKRTILIKEQKILELEDLENQNSLYKSQIKYLENAIEQEKKKIREETKKNKKLQNEINELRKTQKSENENSNDLEMLKELKLHGSITGGVVKDFMDKEKMRKLAKDIEILKEVCRARYTEIKRLEAENASLKNTIPKNSNQMDSPIRTRAQRKSKTLIKEMWKPEVDGKENFLPKQ